MVFSCRRKLLKPVYKKNLPKNPQFATASLQSFPYLCRPKIIYSSTCRQTGKNRDNEQLRIDGDFYPCAL